MATAKLQVEIVGDAKSLQSAFRSAGNDASKFGSALKNLGKVAAVGAAAGFAALGYTLKRGFDELADSQKTLAQTEAVLKSTGGAANVTAKQISDLSTSLSLMSGVDDEVIQGGENMLLTFTNIRNEVGKGNDIFNQATSTLLDMSTALGTDMNKSAIQLGKALNDPIKGITALQRVGVTFTAGQKESIKAMVEAGNTMGAQKLILAELNREFGGSAKAFGETMPGQLAKMRNAFDEVAGNLATKFLPILTNLLNWVNANWPAIEAVINAVGTGIIATFNAIGVAVDWLRSQWEIHRETAIATWNVVQGAVQKTIAWFQANVVPVIQNVISAATAIWNNFGGEIKAIGGRIVATVQVFLQNMLAPFKIFFALLRGDWSAAWDELKATVSRTLGAAIANVKAILSAAASVAGTLAAAIGKAILNGIASGLQGIANKVAEGMQRVWDALRTAATTAYNFAKEIGSKIVSGIWDGFKGLIGGIKDKISGAIGGIISGIDVPGFSPPEAAGAKGIGIPIAEGMIRGFIERAMAGGKEMGQSARAALEGMAPTIAAASRVLGQRSVSELIAGQLGLQPSLNQQMATMLRVATANAIEEQKKQIEASKQGVADAFAGLASAALAAFDAVTDGWENPLRKKLDAEALQAEADKLAQAVADAQAKLAGLPQPPPLKLGEVPSEEWKKAEADYLAAQAELNAALKEEKDFQNQQDILALDAIHEMERQALRDSLGEQINDIMQSAVARKKSWKQVHKEVIALLRSFGVDFKTIGRLYGEKMGDGIIEAVDALDAALKEWAKRLKSSSPPKKGPLREIDKWGRNLGRLYAESIAKGITDGLSSLRPALAMGEDYLGLKRREGKTGDISTDGGGGGDSAVSKPDWADSDIWDAAVGMATKAGQLSQLVANLTPFGSIASNARLLDLMHQNRTRFNWGPAFGRVKRFLDLMGPPEWLSGAQVASMFGLAKGGIVTRPTFAMMGEKGPEAVLPLDRFLGGFARPVVNVYVAGSVRSERDLTEAVYDGLLRLQRKNRRLQLS